MSVWSDTASFYSRFSADVCIHVPVRIRKMDNP